MNIKSAQKAELKFLIATDVHLGHSQNHFQLGNDSYNGFEQVLGIAKRQLVDFLLLGGDLFDEVNPTQKCIFKCLNILRENIFGGRELEIGVSGILPNFSNQNLNISLPIFTIHGNHDYPSNDFGKISVCDLLHASYYVNYFGKHVNVMDQHGQKSIVIKPLIFQKNNLNTKLAIYGLGYIKDFKLNEMFQKNLVVFQQPEDKTNTLCIFILHQNRYKGKKGGVGSSYENCVHAEQFPKWMDLIIWGHQHQAIYQVQTQSDLPIFQPGSTVITSYIQAETPKKQCALISIKSNKQFQIQSILLESSFRFMFTRTYIIQQILSKYGINGKINFDSYFDQELANIVKDVQGKGLGKKPIVRIKIDYTGHNIIRLIRVQEKYKGMVANSNKIFTYNQKRIPNKNTFTLQDEQVLNMIKNSTVPRNIGRQVQLSQQILDKLIQQFTNHKLIFFNIQQIKDMIVDYSNLDERNTVSDIKQTIGREIDKKCIENKKQIINFHKNNQKDFKRLYQKLLKNATDNYKGIHNEDFNPGDVRADINRLKNLYEEKQQQIMNVMNVVQSKSGGGLGGDTQLTSKTVKPIQELSGSDKNSKNSLLHYHKDKKQGNESLRLSSDEEDCCQKAQKEDYRQNQTRDRFQKANQMVENKKKQGKGKKKEFL